VVTRVDIKAILRDPRQRRELLIRACLALQHREGIETTREQMEAAADAVEKEHRHG
jgi:hypothetical protein